MSISDGPNSRNARAHRQRKAKSPGDDQPDRAGKGAPVARAIGLAAELLGGVGETIEEEGADQQEVVQHRIGGEREVAGARALRGEEQPHRDQRRGADHDVAVDREHAHQLGALEQRPLRDGELPLRQGPRDQDAEQEPDRFRGHRGDRRARDAGVEHQHQQHGRRRVDDVDRDLHGQRQPRARLSDQPAEHDIIDEHQRRGPDADA